MTEPAKPAVWEHKDEWRLFDRASGFTVLVSRHYGYPEKPNSWCVYAIIEKKHPLFAALDVGHDEDYYEIKAIHDLPLHGGCTYFERLRYDKDADGKYGREWKRGDTYAFKVGCDYGHLHDEMYAHMETKADASGVFYDAECLFAALIPTPSNPPVEGS